jgi:mRNA interferase MazF
MKRGDICLASFPFGDRPEMKLRPVLLLTDPIGSHGELLVAYISSVVPATLLSTDLLLDPKAPEYRSTNLKVESVLRLHKLATVHRQTVVRRLGAISPATEALVRDKLRSMLRL